MAATSAAAGLLGRQLKQMQGDKDIPGISCGLVGSNIFEWEVMLMINEDCRYYGGKVTGPYTESVLTGHNRGLLSRDPDVP
jgi:ubiquitin-protein ligase